MTGRSNAGTLSPTTESVVSAHSYQPALVGEDHGGDPVADAELREDAPDMRLDRREAEKELVGYLVVGSSARDQPEDLALPTGQIGELRFAGRRADACRGEPLDEPPRDRR